MEETEEKLSIQQKTDNDISLFLSEFLARIGEAKKASSSHEEVQQVVHDCIYLLLRLGYNANMLHQLSGVSDGFLRASFYQLGLNAPPAPLTEVADIDTLHKNIINGRSQSIEPHSKIQSFMDSVQLVKEESRVRSQSVPTLNQPVLQPAAMIQSSKTTGNWLSESKVSLSDSDDEKEQLEIEAQIENKRQEKRQVPMSPYQDRATGMTRLMTVPEYVNEEKHFNKVFKNRLQNLSTVDLRSRHGAQYIDETRNKLVSDVNKFMDYVVSLKNRELMSSRRASVDSSGIARRRSSVSTEQQSPRQEILISNSFVKMTKVC